VSTYKS